MKQQHEIWKPAPDNYDNYEVSSLGRVRNAKRGRPRKVFQRRDGYCQVRLYRQGEARTFSLHRLVAETFLGPAPPGLIVNHQNGVKHDCRLENLCYCTHKENAEHARANGLVGKNQAVGERNGAAKLTTKKVLEIRRLVKAGWPLRKLAERFEVCFSTVWNVAVRRYWKSV
jgi:hypothetical protein